MVISREDQMLIIVFHQEKGYGSKSVSSKRWEHAVHRNFTHSAQISVR